MLLFQLVTTGMGSRGSTVSIAARYGLEGPGIESRWGRDFPHPFGPALRSTRPNNGYWVFPGGKAAEAWRWPPTPSSAEVKGRVELYLYSPSGPSWPVLGWTLLDYWNVSVLDVLELSCFRYLSLSVCSTPCQRMRYIIILFYVSLAHRSLLQCAWICEMKVYE